jgi:hypothetical protein
MRRTTWAMGSAAEAGADLDIVTPLFIDYQYVIYRFTSNVVLKFDIALKRHSRPPDTVGALR